MGRGRQRDTSEAEWQVEGTVSGHQGVVQRGDEEVVLVVLVRAESL